MLEDGGGMRSHVLKQTTMTIATAKCALTSIACDAQVLFSSQDTGALLAPFTPLKFKLWSLQRRAVLCVRVRTAAVL